MYISLATHQVHYFSFYTFLVGKVSILPFFTVGYPVPEYSYYTVLPINLPFQNKHCSNCSRLCKAEYFKRCFSLVNFYWLLYSACLFMKQELHWYFSYSKPQCAYFIISKNFSMTNDQLVNKVWSKTDWNQHKEFIYLFWLVNQSHTKEII